MPEYNVKGQRVDYALAGVGGKPAAIIEAKKLGAGAQLYCEVHGSKGFSVDSARKLLQACGQGPEGVSVRIERG